MQFFGQFNGSFFPFSVKNVMVWWVVSAADIGFKVEVRTTILIIHI